MPRLTEAAVVASNVSDIGAAFAGRNELSGATATMLAMRPTTRRRGASLRQLMRGRAMSNFPVTTESNA